MDTTLGVVRSLLCFVPWKCCKVDAIGHGACIGVSALCRWSNYHSPNPALYWGWIFLIYMSSSGDCGGYRLKGKHIILPFGILATWDGWAESRWGSFSPTRLHLLLWDGGCLSTARFKSAVATPAPNYYKISAKRLWTKASGVMLGLHSAYILPASLTILWVISYDVWEKVLSHLKGNCDAESLTGRKGHFNLYE